MKKRRRKRKNVTTVYKMGYVDVNNAKHVVSGEEWYN